jgi:two-component system nitrate/nitrite response regulator NarL
MRADVDRMLILLAGPPGVFREGLARILFEFGDATDVRCVDDLASALQRNAPVDAAVLDGCYGQKVVQILGAARALTPSTPIIVLLQTIDLPLVEELLAAGAAACVEKTASSGMLLGALRVVLAGGIYLPPSLFGAAAETWPTVPALSPLSDYQPAKARDRASALTPRQIEVLALLARGESNKAIARQLDISELTVKSHLSTVYKELKVSNRGQAANLAIRQQSVLDEQARRAFAGNIPIGRLIPHMSPRRILSGKVLFSKGDATDALYYVIRGIVHLEEMGFDVGAGTLLGEIGLFTADRRRTSTARCKTDADLLAITATDAMRVFYQDPEFGLYVIHLITSRLEADKLRAKGSIRAG